MMVQKYEVYRHYKGDEYVLVNDEATLEETGDKAVIYFNRRTWKVFVQPKERFFGNTTYNGKEVKRFARVES